MTLRRGQFIAGLGAAAAWPLAAWAQGSGRIRRIAVLVLGNETDSEMQARNAAFRQGLEQLGWSDGRNIHIDFRFSGRTPEMIPQLARELVALNPDVIFAHGSPAAIAVHQQTQTIPIVFDTVSDPIGAGLVASLARPGGNITGLLLYEDGIIGKWLGMLREIAPGLTRAALIGNPKSTPFDHFIQAAEAISPSLGIKLVPTPVDNYSDDLPRMIGLFAREPNGGLVLLPDASNTDNRDLIIALAARYRLPAVYVLRVYVTAGGLMSYGTDVVAQNRQAASYVDRILRGLKPSDLPVEAPTKYETIVNLKTAKALGFEVPPTLLVRADEVIE